MFFHLLEADTLSALAAATEAITDTATEVPAAGAAASAPAVQPTQMSESLWDLFTMGGPLMWVLLVLSILAIYLIGRKWWTIKHASKIDPHFMQDIRDYMNAGKVKSAITLCGKYDNPVARMVETGIHRMGRPMSDIQGAIENIGNVEVARLEKGLPILATIAGGAPMIGFLGTVMGMVNAFFQMSKAGNNIDITLLSDGIYTAMLTTVGGLIVGIIAYFGYNWLTSQVSNLVYKMESSTLEFIDIVINEPGEEQ
ncbi:MAG: MotA/TolQ/ExbB proton channel family protein [Bacteroidales bacterium]|nr:MotA/TolQ/ExbB proton channel family protein [Bacteroidales bacterium]